MSPRKLIVRLVLTPVRWLIELLIRLQVRRSAREPELCSQVVTLIRDQADALRAADAAVADWFARVLLPRCRRDVPLSA